MKCIRMSLYFIIICTTPFFLSACTSSSQASESSTISSVSQVSTSENEVEHDLKLTKLYKEIVKSFQETNAENVLNNKLVKGNLLYFGRETCPFCREFLPVLKETSDLYHTPFKIYYLNTEDSHKNSQIKKAMEKYNVTGVPTLIYLKKDNGFEVLNEEQTTLPEWFNIIMKY